MAKRRQCSCGLLESPDEPWPGDKCFICSKRAEPLRVVPTAPAAKPTLGPGRWQPDALRMSQVDSREGNRRINPEKAAKRQAMLERIIPRYAAGETYAAIAKDEGCTTFWIGQLVHCRAGQALLATVPNIVPRLRNGQTKEQAARINEVRTEAISKQAKGRYEPGHCTKCNQVKPLEEMLPPRGRHFPKWKEHHYWCKECNRKYQRQRTRENSKYLEDIPFMETSRVQHEYAMALDRVKALRAELENRGAIVSSKARPL